MGFKKSSLKFFQTIQYIITFIGATVLSLLFWIFDKEEQVPIWGLAIAYVLILLLLNLYFQVKSEVKQAIEREPIRPLRFIEVKNKPICLLHENKHVELDDLLTIIRGEQEEVYLLGHVHHIQKNGEIQLILNTDIEHYREFINDMNSPTSLATINVRPSKHNDYFDGNKEA